MYLSHIIITNLAYSINTRNIKFDITLVKHQSLKPRITNVWIYSDKETNGADETYTKIIKSANFFQTQKHKKSAKTFA